MKNKTVILILSILAVAIYTTAVINFCLGDVLDGIIGVLIASSDALMAYTLYRVGQLGRMAEEYDQLAERYGKLTDFLTTDKFGTLPENTQTLLKRQHQAMYDYREALGQRIRIDAEAANLKVEIHDPDEQ